MTGYYDIVLGLIPLSLAVGTAVLLGLGLELTASVMLSSVLTVALVGHAMFVNAPADDVTPSGTSTGEPAASSNDQVTTD